MLHGPRKVNVTDDPRLRAAHHVLIAIGSIVPPEQFPGECRIRGQVIHVWSGSITIGTTLELSRVAAMRGQEPQGSDDWSSWDTIRNARYLDAYIDGSGNYHTLVRGGAVFLQALPAGVKATADPAASAANWALGSSLVGIGCFPFSILAVIFSFRSFSQARRMGKPIPGRAVVALLLSLLVVGAATLIWVSVRSYEKNRDAASQAVKVRLKGKRTSASLDQETACELVQEQLFAGSFGSTESNSKVACRGPLHQGGDRAALENVDVQFLDGRDQLTICLARTARWFVAGVVGSGASCPTISVPPSKGTDDASRDAQETTIRKTLADTFDRANMGAFLEAVRSVRNTLNSEPRGEHPCDALDISDFASSDSTDRLKPATVDLAFLTRDPNAKDDWPFLTSDWVRDVLSGNAAPHDRAAEVAKIRRSGGPYLVVYESNRRVLPEVKKKQGVLSDEFSYVGGEFVGWMIVADRRDGKIVCEGKLSFSNSSGIRYKSRGLSSEESRVQSSVMDDLEEQFKTKATDEIRRLSNGKLRLGYKLLE